ncbi:MAG TPA: hypothetical protein VJX67_26340 [Blastocatellia bacterium]|nr:hypothetical protein [Blastocatellia bacterium]
MTPEQVVLTLHNDEKRCKIYRARVRRQTLRLLVKWTLAAIPVLGIVYLLVK